MKHVNLIKEETMKVVPTYNKQFTPVLITLETENEARALIEALTEAASQSSDLRAQMLDGLAMMIAEASGL